MANKLRAAVIGVGVGFNHIHGYQTSPLAEMAAICDMNPAVLKYQGDAFKIPEDMRFTDYMTLLKRDDIDATPPAT